MAETDYSLISGISQQSDPIRKAGQVFELKDLINQDQIGQLKVTQAKQQAADMAAAKKALQGIDISTPEGQHQAAQALNKIDPALGMDFLKQTADLSKSQDSVTDEQLDIWGKQNDIIAGAANQLLQQYSSMVGANPPGSPADTQARAKMQGQYQQMIQQLSQAKLPNGQPVLDRNHLSMIVANPQFDPGFIQGIIQQSNKGKQLIQQQIDQKKLGLAERGEQNKEAQETERERHDRALEDQAAAKASRSATGGFSGGEGDLMAALAERGISLPAGFRSQKQQEALLAGLIRRNPGQSVDQIADGIKRGQIEFGAQKKETQTAAAQAGKVQIAANELSSFIPLAQQASAKVPRGKFVPFNKLEQMTDQELSDPDLAAFKSYTKSVINAYNQIAGRSGTSVEERKSNVDMLSTTTSPEVYNAILATMQKEAAAAKGAALEATKSPELNDTAQTAAPAAAGPAPAPGKVVDWHNLP